MGPTEYKCQSCLASYTRESSKDLTRHCRECGLFRKGVDGSVKSYSATLEGSIAWMDNFARRRDLSEDIVVNGVAVRRKVTCSISDDYSIVAVASTTYYAYAPNRSYVETLIRAKRLV